MIKQQKQKKVLRKGRRENIFHAVFYRPFIFYRMKSVIQQIFVVCHKRIYFFQFLCSNNVATFMWQLILTQYRSFELRLLIQTFEQLRFKVEKYSKTNHIALKMKPELSREVFMSNQVNNLLSSIIYIGHLLKLPEYSSITVFKDVLGKSNSTNLHIAHFNYLKYLTTPISMKTIHL